MPIKGLKDLERKNQEFFESARKIKTERAVRRIVSVGAANAARLTPVDTSNLINSQFIKISTIPTGMRGIVGYTANYAAAVNQPNRKTRDGRSYSLLRFKKASAEFDFLRKGFERDGADEIKRILQEEYGV